MPYIDTPQDQSVGMWDTGAGDYSAGSSDVGLGIGATGIIFLLIAYKAITDSNLVSFDVHKFNVTLITILGVFLAATAGKVAFLAITGLMTKYGFVLPGQLEVARLL